MSVAEADFVRRFVIERQDIRGQLVHLDAAWLALREHGAYPPSVRDLLGEAVAAAVLLASTLKFEGMLTLQLQGDGAVRLLVAQCSHDFRLRGVARFDEQRVTAAAGDFAALAGAGLITVTLESQTSDARYQGVVPLDGRSIAECLEHYFANSEQLPTAVRLASDVAAVSGLLVQRMPSTGGSDSEGVKAVVSEAAEGARLVRADASFAAAQAALAALDRDELLTRDAAELVQRCLPEQDVRLLPQDRVRFECRCSPQRVSGMLRSLGEEEVRSVLAEQGGVTVTCEFCHRPYRFDAIDVEKLFVEAAMDASGRVN